MKKRFWYALALLSGVTCSGIASAQQSGSDVDELRARLDRLEQQNMQLRQAVAQRLPVVDPDTDNGSGDPQFTSTNNLADTPDDARMNAAIAKYMKDEAAKKKALADQQRSDGIEVGNPNTDRSAAAGWTNDGLTLKSGNGDYTFHMRGLAQLDDTALQNPAAGIGVPGGAGTQDSVQFRRLRLGAEGTMHDNIDWVFEFDFAFALQNVDPTTPSLAEMGLRGTGSAATGTIPAASQSGNAMGTIQPTTIFMTFKEIDYLGNIRVGNQQSWISQEHIESARFTDFMERASIMDAFNGANNNGYMPGISCFNTTENKRLAAQAGVYANNVYNSGFDYTYGNSAFVYGGRICGTPYYDEASNGRYLLHCGVGAEYRVFNTELTNGPTSSLGAGNGNTFSSPYAGTYGDNIRIRVRGDIRNGVNTLDPNFADTGNFYAVSQECIDPEMAFQWGSLLIQAEYEYCGMNGARTRQGPTGQQLGAVNFNGGYISMLYFLTGENRTYNKTSGVFGRVVPITNAFATKGAGGRGWGAWQVGARYDWIDLNSGTNPLVHVLGGYNQNLTLGVNWFLNSNARFQFNYVASWIDNPVNAANATSAANGTLQGSNFKGDGIINSLGARMDFNF